MILRHFALLAVIAAVPAAALAPAPLKVGRWKERIEITRMTLGGDILPFGADEDRVQEHYRCLASASGARAFLETQMPRQHCTGITGGAMGGKIAMTGTCNVGHGPAKVSMNGTFGGGTYRVDVRNAMDQGGQEMVLESRVDGTFQGPCQGDERP